MHQIKMTLLLRLVDRESLKYAMKARWHLVTKKLKSFVTTFKLTAGFFVKIITARYVTIR